MTYNPDRYDAIMRAPRPPMSASPYQIKVEAKRRGIWFSVLKPALLLDDDKYEDFLLAREISINNETVDAFADLVRGEATVDEYKDSFFREAVGRTIE